MSKRHHTSRRKTYGRRQHELRERPDRRMVPEMLEATFEEWSAGSPADAFSLFDSGAGRIRFALGD